MKAFALRVIDLCDRLPHRPAGWVIGKQWIASACSVGANYRAACRARSHAEFVARIGVGVEEADESEFWLEVIREKGMIPANEVAPLQRESGELLAIFIASQMTAKGIRKSAS